MKKIAVSRTPEWWADRNRRRRERYKKDTTYREHVRALSRKSYRGDHEVKQNIALPEDQLQQHGTPRVMPDIETRRCTFTIEEMAFVLGGYHKVVLYRWLREGKFPYPNHKAFRVAGQKALVNVYTLPQVKRLTRIFRELQTTKAYFYHENDSATVAKLFLAMQPQQ